MLGSTADEIQEYFTTLSMKGFRRQHFSRLREIPLQGRVSESFFNTLSDLPLFLIEVPTPRYSSRAMGRHTNGGGDEDRTGGHWRDGECLVADGSRFGAGRIRGICRNQRGGDRRAGRQ